MRAHILQAYGRDGLVLGDVAEPVVGPGQVAIEVEQIGVNPLDWKLRNGYLADAFPLALPVVIGTDAAGTVLEVGDGVDDLRVGDRVAGFVDSGAFAEVGVTRRARVTRVPDDLTLRDAAALVTAAEASQRAIGLLRLEAASTVLVNGAAGAVGSAVTQLLAADGHRVIGTASEANHDYLRDLGAEPVTYGETLLDELRGVAPQGIDAAIDTAGRGFVERVEPLVPAGRIVTLVDFDAAQRGAIVAAGDPADLAADSIGAVLRRAAAGAFRVQIDSAHAFDRLPEALARSEAGHLRGKVVVSLGGS